MMYVIINYLITCASTCLGNLKAAPQYTRTIIVLCNCSTAWYENYFHSKREYFLFTSIIIDTFINVSIHIFFLSSSSKNFFLLLMNIPKIIFIIFKTQFLKLHVSIFIFFFNKLNFQETTLLKEHQ